MFGKHHHVPNRKKERQLGYNEGMEQLHHSFNGLRHISPGAESQEREQHKGWTISDQTALYQPCTSLEIGSDLNTGRHICFYAVDYCINYCILQRLQHTTFPQKSRLNQFALYLKLSSVLGKSWLDEDQELVSTATPQHTLHFSWIRNFLYTLRSCADHGGWSGAGGEHSKQLDFG